MVYARRTVSRYGLPRVQARPIWSGSRPLLVLWSVVTSGYLAWIAFLVARYHFRLADIALFGALLACGAFTVEMARRSSEPDGVWKDVYAVWELPMVFLLPGLYALIVPAIRLTLTQWRVKRAPVYRRAYTAAAIGLGYGCARLVFLALLPAGAQPRTCLWQDTAAWLVAAGSGATAQWVINQGLILSAYKLANPSASIRDQIFAKETLHNDATELCAALLVAASMTVSNLTLIIALPLATLLQRSFRHAQLLNEARADAKTGLLNAATWEREATAEVARAARTLTPVAVALLDLDRFKAINDTHGHLFGDEVLRRIARTMSGTLREYDVTGRFGGEEFVMMFPHTRSSDAFRIADRVREQIAELPIFGPGGERVHVSVSIGVAALDAGSRRDLGYLLAAADAALYRAKASGRNQVQMLSTSRGLSAVGPLAARDADVDRRGDAAAVAGVPIRRQADARDNQREHAAVGLQFDEAGLTSTATTSALALWHSDASPVRSTSGVG
jgi:diguanylate cyclase (GGDEF)-like protein